MGGSVNTTGTASGIVSSVSMLSLLLLSFDTGDAAEGDESLRLLLALQIIRSQEIS